ncbi:MAG: homocysteine S-methyltransferase family protein [Pseudomonadota bacterium]|nr:homocysteine S-methyltransferase family protein [Pseudomonadota bacterium]
MTHTLPHDTDKLFLTDGGLETTLVFHDRLDLPCFAAFDLLKDDAGTAHLREYYQRYLDLALGHGLGFVLESATWRASADWGQRLGYTEAALARANHRAIELLHQLHERNRSSETPMVISGNIGPRGDGYVPGQTTSPDEAADYHLSQIHDLVENGADTITALTLPATGEAIGMVRAAQSVGIPIVISFTVETDGRLPDGRTLRSAIESVDAATHNGPAYYMINCAHPTHFDHALAGSETWLARIRGVRANASCKSHAELDESDTLDDGDPDELGLQYRALRDRLPNLTVLGGCCGTDHRHVAAIARTCSP